MSRLHREPMRILISELVQGELAPGHMLRREVDLAERFGVSRGVVRECIRGLEERSLIEVKHGRGATVSDPMNWDVFDPDVLSALLEAPGGQQILAEALECQRMLEVEAAGLAAARAQPEKLDDLSQALEAMIAAAGRVSRSEIAAERYREADLQFHRAVVRASGNRTLARMSEPLHRALSAARAEPAGEDDPRVAEHQRILTAITAHDVDGARAAMGDHLAAVGRRVRSRARGG